jgi:alkylhydroperoxidase/carboxymuconolactone decarboxylase family protein YurZ
MGKLPDHYSRFIENYPGVGQAYKSLGEEASAAGPLDRKTICLVKLGMAIASAQEGATHSHTRKALEAGVSPDELRHAALQAVTTLGFPNMMRGLAWVEDVLGKQA